MAATPDILDTHALLEQLTKAVDGFVRVVSIALHPTRLTKAQYFLLRALDRAGRPLRMVEIATATRRSKPNVSHAVARLAAAGFVVVRVRADRPQERSVELTREGRGELAAAEARVAVAFDALRSSKPEFDRRRIAADVERVSIAVCEALREQASRSATVRSIARQHPAWRPVGPDLVDPWAMRVFFEDLVDSSGEQLSPSERALRIHELEMAAIGARR